jgi:aldose 1-epimerase
MSGQELKAFVLTNNNGMTATVTNFGGRVVSLFAPDRNGVLGDVVLGYDELVSYRTGNPYFGAMIGRYGNRIAKGKFLLNGKTYQLAQNNNGNSLHGGVNGFHNVIWDVRMLTTASLEMVYASKDGDEGFPGNLTVKVIYTLTDKNELVIDYEAHTDQTTVVNLTHHSFFNLAGAGNGDVLDHEVTILADRFCAVDETLIPTGALRLVAGTPFDFTRSTKIGKRIDEEYEQLRFGKGYDHNWVLNKSGNTLGLAARVREPLSGRVMEVYTTEPGLQFYSGNFLDGSDIGKGGRKYPFRSAFCLEAQHFPDSPNHADFPSVVLSPSDVYFQKTIYAFSAGD